MFVGSPAPLAPSSRWKRLIGVMGGKRRGSRGREGQKTGGDGEGYFWSCGTRKGASGIAEVYYGVGGG